MYKSYIQLNTNGAKLVVVVSKTFTTTETMLNARTLTEWISSSLALMVKQLFGERSKEDSEIPKWELKRRCASATDVMSGITLHEFVLRLEPFLRRIVQEEVNRAIQWFLLSSSKGLDVSLSSISQIESSGTCAWQLYFYNKIPSTLFTDSRVESEDWRGSKREGA
ncbi:hypothetical protein AgCh_005005 [Apium graveolens]